MLRKIALALALAAPACAQAPNNTGELHAEVPSVTLQDLTNMNRVVSRRIAGQPAPSAWVDAWGGKTDSGADGGARPFDFSGSGEVVGFDRALNDHTTLGAFVGHSSNDLKLGGLADGANAEGLRYGFFGRHDAGGWRVIGMFGFSENDVKSSRHVTVGGADALATAAYQADGWSALAEVSRLWTHAGWELEPSAALQYAHARSNTFTEAGLIAISLSAPETHADSVLGSVGARARYPTTLDAGRPLVPEVRLRLQRELDSSAHAFTATPAAGVVPFTINGGTLDRTVAVVGAGVTVALTQTAWMWLSYDGQLSSRTDTHIGEVGLRVGF